MQRERLSFLVKYSKLLLPPIVYSSLEESA